MKQNISRPYVTTRLATYLERRLSELRSIKTQIAIAAEAGFRAPNVLAMIKDGSAKLPLDRVSGLAKALDCDPAMLFRMAMEQFVEDTTSLPIGQMFGAITTENEITWLKSIREASGDCDPSLTAEAQKAIRAIFGK